jgi:hypothetical protein
LRTSGEGRLLIDRVLIKGSPAPRLRHQQMLGDKLIASKYLAAYNGPAASISTASGDYPP